MFTRSVDILWLHGLFFVKNMGIFGNQLIKNKTYVI